MQRNYTIDIVRGFAIYTMIASNLAGEMLAPTHPLALTIFGSMAAPIFVFLAGYLVAMGFRLKNYNFGYFFIRGILTLLTAAFIDSAFWHWYPFTGVDVLYLTGFSMILTYFFLKLNFNFRIVLTFLIFISGYFIRKEFGYAEVPEIRDLFKDGKLIPFDMSYKVVLSQWLKDGWFPIFGWVGMAFSGACFFDWKNKISEMKTKNYLEIIFFSLSLAIIGSLLVGLEQRYSDRGFYTEVFYPPTISYYFLFLSFALILFMFVNENSELLIYTPLKVIGKSPMFFYLLHFALIAFVISPYFGKENSHKISFDKFIYSYIFIIIISLIFSKLISILKSKWEKPPFIVKFFIGG